MVFEWFECPNTWMTVFLCLFNIDWLNNLYKFYWLAIRIQSIKIEWMNEWMKVKVILIWRDIIVVRLQQQNRKNLLFFFIFLLHLLHPHLLPSSSSSSCSFRWFVFTISFTIPCENGFYSANIGLLVCHSFFLL